VEPGPKTWASVEVGVFEVGLEKSAYPSSAPTNDAPARRPWRNWLAGDRRRPGPRREESVGEDRARKASLVEVGCVEPGFDEDHREAGGARNEAPFSRDRLKLHWSSAAPAKRPFELASHELTAAAVGAGEVLRAD